MMNYLEKKTIQPKKDGIYYFISILLSGNGFRFIGKKFLKVKYIEKNRFEVLEVIKGNKYIKVGDNIYIHPTPSTLFDTLGEAEEEWNQIIRDNLDRLQSFYETTKKRINKELI